MATIPIQEAQAKLPELINGLVQGEELVLTDNGEPMATLTRGDCVPRPRKAGSAREKILWIDPDFDAPLEESPKSGDSCR